MANITIVSTTNSIQVSFNDYSAAVDALGGTWRKENITLHLGLYVVGITIEGEKDWFVSHDGLGGSLIIDSVDGSTPADKAELYTLLQGLIA